MGSICIRKLNDVVLRRLRVRAAQHGISTEQEARNIITQVVSGPAKMSAIFSQRFGVKNGIDLTLPNLRQPHEPMDF